MKDKQLRKWLGVDKEFVEFYDSRFGGILEDIANHVKNIESQLDYIFKRLKKIEK